MSKNKKIIRARFRNAVFTRDNYTCKVCNKSNFSFETFDAHHITNRNDMPNGGYVLPNGITLCANCHLKAEVEMQGRHHKGFSPEELYILINSSYDVAVKKSRLLA